MHQNPSAEPHERGTPLAGVGEARIKLWQKELEEMLHLDRVDACFLVDLAVALSRTLYYFCFSVAGTKHRPKEIWGKGPYLTCRL